MYTPESLKGRGPCMYRDFDAAGAGVGPAFKYAIELEKIPRPKDNRLFDEAQFVRNVNADGRFGFELSNQTKLIQIENQSRTILLTSDPDALNRWILLIDTARRTFGFPVQQYEP